MRLKCLLLICSLAVLAWAQSVTQTETYRRWTRLPSDSLINMGSRFAEVQNKPDSGLICFTIAASRYKPEMSKQEKRSCAQGYIGKWFVYFFCYYDHSQAFENLLHAQEITESIGEGVGRVYLNFGATYQTLSEQSGDLRPDSLALDYYQKSYWQSKHEGDSASLRMAMANMITVAHSLNRMDDIGRELGDYQQCFPATSQFNLLLYQGLKMMQQGRYPEALAAFDQQMAVFTPSYGNARYLFSIYANKARVYDKMGDYDHAIAMASRAQEIAEQIEMKDARLELYGMMGDLYAKSGDTQRAQHYRNQYLQLKDSLLNYHQVASVDELRFMGEMKRVDKQLQDMEHQRRVQHIVMLTLAGIAAIIMLSMLIVWRKNRQLRQRNEALYQKNIEMLEREEQYRAQRRELKQAEQLARQRADQQAQLLAEERAKRLPDQQASAMDHTPEAAETETHPKYKSSSLDEETKQELMARIRDVMENAPEVYSPEFSAQQLATLAGAKYNYISQAINETTGKNFNAMVNEYRIIEACRRINDQQNYGHLTIEAVGNSVGFKSRTSFIQAFKKFTGLTPSEYQRIAREKTEK